MSAKIRRFAQVDVFSGTPYLGNPVAVVLDADGLTDEQMHRLARWTNLSETTFVLKPTEASADYRLRIFTPGGELPFAGHPTLGSAHAWLENGGVAKTEGQLIQECLAGLVTLSVEHSHSIDRGISFEAPPTVKAGPIDSATLQAFAAALGIGLDEIVDHQWVDNGPGWAAIQLLSAESVLALNPDFSTCPDAMLGVVGAYPEGSEFQFELRAFAPKVGVFEDPVTGSLNASVAQWLAREGKFSGGYLASQGQRVGRRGSISIRLDDQGAVWVGGATVTCIQGEIEI